MPGETECIMAREYSGGVVAIDSGMLRPGMAACYLLETPRQAAIIECGNAASTGRILNVLERRGWRPEQVRHVIVTHVHLDHAGGAGRLLEALPEAALFVHPRGARHMIDPARLEASARAVYGDEAFDAMYGALVPVPTDRVVALDDGARLAIDGRELRFMDTPGHARHHFCVWDRQTRGWFTGDTFGISYRDFDTDRGPFIFPTATPIQFDPPTLVKSIERLMAENPDFMYLTHFGRVGDTRRLAADMIAGVHKIEEIALRHRDSPQRTAAIEREMLDWLVAGCRAHGVTIGDDRLTALLQPDVELNTQGVEYWLDHDLNL